VVVSAGDDACVATGCFRPIFEHASGRIGAWRALFQGCAAAARILLVPT